MLSIIICSKDEILFNNVSSNIAKTIGIEYELIKIDNTVKKWGICKAYNEGAKQSKYNYLCFLHEDVKFYSQDWGIHLLELLKNKKNGIVGISGAVYKSKYPSTWSMIPQQYYRITAMQQQNDGSIQKYDIRESPDAICSKVAVVDGVFLAMRKEVWEQYPFDEINIQGFHFYDMDICLRINKCYDILVAHKILLQHFSLGNIDEQWINESIEFHKRYKKTLPCSLRKFTNEDRKQIDYHAISSFVFLLMRTKRYKLAIKNFMNCLKMNFLHKTNLSVFLVFIKTLFK